jgi:DNA-binding CsgD family transcriptional regulator
MTTLNHQDLKDVLLVTGVALECAEIDELRRQVLRCLERMFRCDHNCAFALARSSFNELDLEGVIGHGADPHFLVQYIQHFHRLDPYYTGLPFIPPVVTIDEVIPFRKLVRSEYYNDFLRPQSTHYQMCLQLRSGNRLLGELRLGRPRHARNFSARDKAKAELIVRYLVKVLEEKFSAEQSRYLSELFALVSKQLSYKGIMFLDASLEPLYMDEEAQRIISFLAAEKAHRPGSRQFLPPELYSHLEEMRKSAAEGKPSDFHERRFVLTMGEGSRRLSILLRPVKPWNRPIAFLVCMEPEVHEVSLDHRLGRLGLTRRERELVNLLCLGLENLEIADRLCISNRTVENHLRSIYAKTGVRNRTSLVHKVMTLN